jgi:hypothetical protein
VQLETVESEQRNLFVAYGLSPRTERIYEPRSAAKSCPIDSLVETSGLNSSAVVATLFTLETKGDRAATAGKTVY